MGGCWVGGCGAAERTRTFDLLINSQSHYRAMQQRHVCLLFLFLFPSRYLSLSFLVLFIYRGMGFLLFVCGCLCVCLFCVSGVWFGWFVFRMGNMIYM